MSIRKWFKGAKAKAMIVLGSFAMLLGVGASVSVATAVKENEVVETKAADDPSQYVRIYFSGIDGWTLAVKPSYKVSSSGAGYASVLSASDSPTLDAAFVSSNGKYVCDLPLASSSSDVHGWFKEGNDWWHPNDGNNYYSTDTKFYFTFDPAAIVKITYSSHNHTNNDNKWYDYSISTIGHFVHYNYAGGTKASGAKSNVEAANNTSFSIQAAPTREGYTFNGWLCSANSRTYDPGDSYSTSSAVTFTAQWTIKTYTVTCCAVINGTVYPSNHATYGLGTQVIDHGGTLDDGDDFPADRQYFLKWWGSYSAGVFSVEITTITSTQTVYAEYVDYSRSQDVYLVGSMESWSVDNAYKMYFDPTHSSDGDYYYYIDISTSSANATFKIFDEEHFDGDARYIGWLDKTKDYDTSAPNLIGDDQSVGGGGGSDIILKKVGAYRIIYNYRGVNDKSVCRISAAATFTVYFADCGANWSTTYAYEYQHGNPDHDSSAAWPGNALSSSTSDISFKGGKLFKHVFNAGNYYPTDIIFNDGTSDGTEAVGVNKTANLVLGDGFGYFFSAGGGGGSSAYGDAMSLIWDIRAACGTYTKNGKTYAASICKIDQSTASGFVTRYNSLVGSAKSDFDAATFHTYGGTWQYGTTANTDVTFEAIMDQLDAIANPSSAKTVPGAPSANQSPLTLTLWIVLGAGVLGLGAIGTAYFVSKKKKRHQA